MKLRSILAVLAITVVLSVILASPVAAFGPVTVVKPLMVSLDDEGRPVKPDPLPTVSPDGGAWRHGPYYGVRW